jgi:hypothetical protein
MITKSRSMIPIPGFFRSEGPGGIPAAAVQLVHPPLVTNLPLRGRLTVRRVECTLPH